MTNNIQNFLDKHFDNVIVGLVLLISLASYIFYYSSNLTMTFGDSKGHMNIARRVFDSPTPGLVQLGGYWLPLMHVLMLPTVWNDFFWHTGLSGSIVSMGSYIVSSYVIYLLIVNITKSKKAGLLGFFLFALNPNLIFMQTTPMTEVLFILTVILATFFFQRWTIKRAIPDIVLTGLFLMLASVTRYEGWALVAMASFFIIIEWILNKQSKKNESAFFLMSSIAWFGIVMWILWGTIILHDPLDFLRNDLSAINQTKDFTTVTGHNDLPKALLTNILAIKHVAGAVVAGSLIIGLIVYLARRNKKVFSISNSCLLLLIAPFLFDAVSVFLGNVPVEVPELHGNYFNIRYALFSLPAISVFLALLSTRKLVQIAIFAIVMTNYLYLLYPNYHNLASFKDAGASASGRPEEDLNVVKNFRKLYTGGYILASTGANDGFMFDAKIPLKNYISEGSYRYWDLSMEDPSKYATWVLMSSSNERDAVNKYVNKTILDNKFTIVYRYNTYQIYKKID
jgi:dolichyl-phosphate-mannose-protein mannosyltransferase